MNFWLLCIQTHLTTAKHSVIPFVPKPLLLILEERKQSWSESAVQGEQRGTFPLPRLPTCCSSSQMHVYDGVHLVLPFLYGAHLVPPQVMSFLIHTSTHTAHLYTVHSWSQGEILRLILAFTDTDRILTQATFIKNGCF